MGELAASLSHHIQKPSVCTLSRPAPNSPSLPWRLEEVWVVAQQTTQWGSGGLWKEIKHQPPSPIPFSGLPLFTFPALTGEPQERSTTERLSTHTACRESKRPSQDDLKHTLRWSPHPFPVPSVLGPQSEICAYKQFFSLSFSYVPSPHCSLDNSLSMTKSRIGTWGGGYGVTVFSKLKTYRVSPWILMEQGITVQEQRKVMKNYSFSQRLKSDLMEFIFYHVGQV